MAALARRPVPVSYDQLIDFMYSTSIDGGPLTAYQCMKVVIFRCRKKIAAAKLPWFIETIYGHGHILHRKKEKAENGKTSRVTDAQRSRGG